MVAPNTRLQRLSKVVMGGGRRAALRGAVIVAVLLWLLYFVVCDRPLSPQPSDATEPWSLLEDVIAPSDDVTTVAGYVAPEEFRIALAVPRSCPVMATFTSERLVALLHDPTGDGPRAAARQGPLTVVSGGCYGVPTIRDSPPLCDRFQDFLDGRCEVAMRRWAGQRDNNKTAHRFTGGYKPAGLLSPPTQHWFWTPVRNCAWRSATRPLVGLGYLNRIADRRSDGPLACPGSPECRCWAHAGLWTPPPGAGKAPRVGGQWLQSWDDVPSIATLFHSKRWFADLLGIADGGATGGRRPPTIVIAGHSHARNLFLGAVGVVEDVVGEDKRVVRYGILEHVAVGIALPGGRLHPILIYAPATAVSYAGLDRSTLERAFRAAGSVSDGDADFEIRPDLIVLIRGVWEMEKADAPVDHFRAAYASELVLLRRAYPSAVIMSYLPHYMHAVHSGCGGRVRQVEWRDAMACGVVTANAVMAREFGGRLEERHYFTEVFDAFDVTATRRFVKDPDMARPPYCTLKPSLLPAPQNGSELEICDGQHYDAPTQFNVFAALMLQASKSPLWRTVGDGGHGASIVEAADSAQDDVGGGHVGPIGLCRVAIADMKLRKTELSPLPRRFSDPLVNHGSDRWRCADCLGDDLRDNLGCLELRLRRVARCTANQSTTTVAGAPVRLDAPMHEFVPLNDSERVAKSAELTALINAYCPRWPFATPK